VVTDGVWASYPRGQWKRSVFDSRAVNERREMQKRKKKKILGHLQDALNAIAAASVEAGPVNDAGPDDVTVCLHISNAAEDITAAMKELKNGI
jgi:hypothetical protein